MVDTSDEWITERTGTKERRILQGEGRGTAHMEGAAVATPNAPAAAVPGLLDRTAPRAQHVDLLICATTTPDFVFPSTANIVCDMVGIRTIGSFDVQAACSGFVYALPSAAQFIG